MKKEYFIYALVFVMVLGATIFFGHKTKSSNVPSSSVASVQNSSDVDSETFLGDVIHVNQPWPSKISSIELSVQVPSNYKFLTEAKPYAKLSSPQGLIKEWTLEDAQQKLDLNQEVAAQQLSMELGLFYCREGDEGLCLAKKVLFKILVVDGAKFQPVSLSYKVSDDKF